MSKTRNKQKKKTPIQDRIEKKEILRVRAKTANQQVYIDAINQSKIVFCAGPAGCGKTKIAVSMAVEAFFDKKVERIIITRPVVQVSENLGFLPGGLEDKMDPYLTPIFEELKDYLSYQELVEWKNSGKLVIVPLAYMRGRNFHNSFIIADESQNLTRDQMIMLLTRIGQNSKMVVNGDPAQCDLYKQHAGAFMECIAKLGKIDGITTVKLTALDVVREPIVSKIIEALNLD